MYRMTRLQRIARMGVVSLVAMGLGVVAGAIVPLATLVTAGASLTIVDIMTRIARRRIRARRGVPVSSQRAA
jgi:hypothetical protein